jgi:hypothetical protein
VTLVLWHSVIRVLISLGEIVAFISLENLCVIVPDVKVQSSLKE